MPYYEKELEEMITNIKNATPNCDDLTLINSVPFLYPFSARLSNFIMAHGYCGAVDGEESIHEKIKFVQNRYQSIDPSDSLANNTTVSDWFHGIHSPNDNANSRKNMYKLCFALHLTAEEVNIFFQTVYLQRAFYCRDLQEAVYYYSFLHQYPYDQANKLYEKINQILSKTPVKEIPSSYTLSLKSDLEKKKTEEELVAYFIEHQKNFLQYNSSNNSKEALSNNQTARNKIQSLIEQLCGTEKDKAILQMVNGASYLGNPNTNPKEYGYAIQEYLLYNDSFEALRGKTRKPASSISLLLYLISGFDCIEERKQNPNFSIAKNSRFHKAIRCNFPSKWSFSNILDEKPSHVSDDKVRKALILLEFYTFWVKERLSRNSYPLPRRKLFQIFVDELNQTLYDCGFNELYCKNFYDFLFLYASFSEEREPLDIFRDIISDAIEEKN